jgi:PAS domain S-box-containing protein
MMKLFPHHV